MDLIVDSYNHAILTVVERSTNMLFMTKLPHGKKSDPLAKELRKLLLPYKKHIKTITTDNGPEFAAHKLITQYLGAVVYFAAPYASWQKGAIENTNKLISASTFFSKAGAASAVGISEGERQCHAITV